MCLYKYKGLIRTFGCLFWRLIHGVINRLKAHYGPGKREVYMSRDIILKERWELLVERLSAQFSDGDPLELDSIIYLIGVQELGQYHRVFKKDEKINLMHIAICRLLEPYGYYEFDYFDEQGWPHYNVKSPLPSLKPGEQSVLMKEAIVEYFLEKDLIQ